jgi:cell wall-associated NlpC family hydrolase
VSAGTSTSTPGSTTGTATGNVTVANTGGEGLNCRSGAGTSHSVITVLSLGQTIQSRSGSTSGWTAVICGGKNGFVSSQFVSGGQASTAPAPTAPKPTAPSGIASGSHVKTTDALNLRYSGNTSSSISTVIPAGKVIKVTGALSNSYYPVDYDGLAGYVHSDYVVKTSEALSQRGGSATPTNPAPAPAPAPSTPSGSALVNYAMRYVGYPYVWATHGPASFDCSGFTYWVVQNVMGKNIGYGTWTQVSAGTPVSKANLQAGDLVFFQNTYTAGLSHVGLYIGNGQFIHAQNEETGVVISDLNSSYYGPRWYGGVRL